MQSEYPIYTKSERIADGLMHSVGVIGALAGAIGLIIWATGMFSPTYIIAMTLYAATLITTFVASAF